MGNLECLHVMKGAEKTVLENEVLSHAQQMISSGSCPVPHCLLGRANSLRSKLLTTAFIASMPLCRVSQKAISFCHLDGNGSGMF